MEHDNGFYFKASLIVVFNANAKHGGKESHLLAEIICSLRSVHKRQNKNEMLIPQTSGCLQSANEKMKKKRNHILR